MISGLEVIGDTAGLLSDTTFSAYITDERGELSNASARLSTSENILHPQVLVWGRFSLRDHQTLYLGIWERDPIMKRYPDFHVV